MQKPDSASAQSVEDFRVAVAASFETSGAVLLNLIEALAAGSSPGAPVEVSESAMFAYGHDSLYQALRRAAAALGEEIDSPDWLLALRTARLAWLAKHPPPPLLRADLGPWKIRILDASNHYRPQVRTVRVGYVHGADGMKPGMGLSVLAERVGEGSWTLPLEVAWMPPETGPTSFGAEQMKAFVAAHGWPPEYVLDVDSQYTVRPFLEPVTTVGVNVLGRVRNNRVFYLPVAEYCGFGRPAQLGAKFKLNDPATHPAAEVTEKWELPTGGRVEAHGWRDVRQKGWAAQPLTLYQVIEYRADGKPRYKRPLWLMFVAGQSVKVEAPVVEAPVVEAPVVEAPTPRQAEAIYDERFSIEHAIRFSKQELGLVSGQFNSIAAEGREQTWVELVATAHWLLWVLRAVVDEEKASWPAWWRSRKLTPGALHRLAAGLFLGLDWHKPEVKPRGKSSGRATGAKQTPRLRFKVYRAES
jgi:DDE superfamily endonuclease